MQTWSRRHEQILGRPQIVCKSGFHLQLYIKLSMLRMAKLSMLRGFTKGVSVVFHTYK